MSSARNQELTVQWERKTLGQCARFINGRAYSQDELLDQGTPVIRIQNLNGGDRWYYSNLQLPDEKYCVKGDLLFAWSASFGPYLWCGDRAIFHYHIWRILPSQGVEKAFLFRLLEWITARVKAASHGVAMLHMTKAGIEAWEVSLPPLPEQRRIAAILDQADALRAKRREALAQLDSLTQSIFIEMFGKPTTSRDAWEVRRLDEVTECLDRLRRPVTESDRKPGAIPYFGANGQQGWIDTHLFDEPLVLVAEDGGHFDNPSRGVAYRVDGKCWVNNHAHILRPKNDVLDVEYLHRALRNFDFTPYVSGTTRAKLTQGQLNGVPLMVPPIATQRVFADRVHRIERMRNLFGESLNDLDALFASLQHRAFAGQLS